MGVIGVKVGKIFNVRWDNVKFGNKNTNRFGFKSPEDLEQQKKKKQELLKKIKK